MTTRNLAILLLPDVDVLDFCGPFEVFTVANRFVDPMSIQVPRERKLDGKDLAEFQKERARIEELMRRAPVMTANK